jgi:hypothetical protein
MSSPRRSSRRSRRNTTSAVSLPEEVQAGLKILVSDNASTVAKMLDCESEDVNELVQKCAQVLQQQQLSPSMFLARFFDKTVLQQHAEFLKKSSKGSVPVLAERIANFWALNPPMLRWNEKGEDGKTEFSPPTFSESLENFREKQGHLFEQGKSMEEWEREEKEYRKKWNIGQEEDDADGDNNEADRKRLKGNTKEDEKKKSKKSKTTEN